MTKSVGALSNVPLRGEELEQMILFPWLVRGADHDLGGLELFHFLIKKKTQKRFNWIVPQPDQHFISASSLSA